MPNGLLILSPLLTLKEDLIPPPALADTKLPPEGDLCLTPPPRNALPSMPPPAEPMDWARELLPTLTGTR